MSGASGVGGVIREYPNGARVFHTLGGCFGVDCPLHGRSVGIWIGEQRASEAAAVHAECYVPPPAPPAKSRRRYSEMSR